ncbi:MAG: hypothetical protein WCE62_21755 [Polyangiales bacterium]
MRHRRSPTSIGVTLCLAGAAGLLSLSCTSDRKLEGDALIGRGQYLVATSGCDDCHSPKIFTEMGPHPDPKRRLSGHPAGSTLPAVPYDLLSPDKWGAVTTPDMTAWAGPWGISFGVNLTPHPDGLGLWTEEQFVKSLKSGMHLGVGRPVLPPMPWPNYSKMSDEDLRAMFAYLKTLPPIANLVPQPTPPQLTQTETAKP